MWVGVAAGGVGAVDQSAAGPQTERTTPSPQRATIDRYCVSCHNTRLKTADLALDTLDLAAVGEHPEVWEKVVRKLRGGLMPPAGTPAARCSPRRTGWSACLEKQLDSSAAARPESWTHRNIPSPEPRRVPQRRSRRARARHRRGGSLLPGDSASYGFDNMAGALKVSESLMERYLSAARKISRAAVGGTPSGVAAQTYTVSPGAAAGRARRGPAVRHARRHAHQASVPAGRRVRLPLRSGEHVRRRRSRRHARRRTRSSCSTSQRGGRAVDADGNELSEKLEIRTQVERRPARGRRRRS